MSLKTSQSLKRGYLHQARGKVGANQKYSSYSSYMEVLFMHKMEAQHLGKGGEDVLVQDLKTSAESGYESKSTIMRVYKVLKLGAMSSRSLIQGTNSVALELCVVTSKIILKTI